ncbi:hypothetical protein HYDPIDRAFT_111975 [Hydnomerulius pinastri MD-312]|uniref:Alpha/beta hydrolase fold-3 domain-containing protein n=1 Tax=Hydnomerulius pinastri MD-312 TaxID=994086 RepID=A0A0C9WF96_9AGAM|nr:hypothetical protein HYDPIDRAFT_111975 [Hydnomerulius pinastri MD-312]
MDIDHLSFAYKVIDNKPILLDVYLPYLDNLQPDGVQPDHRPTVIYFHGGGLTVGNRQSWFPFWLQKRLSLQGCIFVSADYRLIPPSNGHDIIDDIRDVFSFVRSTLNGLLGVEKERVGHDPQSTRLGGRLRVDPEAVGVAGTSAGGLCAYLAAMHVSPKPKVVLSMYGMGGDFLTPHYLSPKFKSFLRGREMLDPADFPTFLYPGTAAVYPTSDSPLAYHPPTYRIPGYPSNPRMLLGRLYLQLGTFLDYYTGQHEPSLSACLRAISSGDDTLRLQIPEKHLDLFPQLWITTDWPSTCLVHGTSDTAVHIQESQNMLRLLQQSRVEAELLEVEGKEHSFDYEPGAQELHRVLFDHVVSFLMKRLIPSASV